MIRLETPDTEVPACPCGPGASATTCRLDEASLGALAAGIAAAGGPQLLLFQRVGDGWRERSLPGAPTGDAAPAAACRVELLAGLPAATAGGWLAGWRCGACGGLVRATALRVRGNQGEQVLAALLGHGVPEPEAGWVQLMDCLGALAARRAAEAETCRDVERRARNRSEFLASMSHELRTPLTGIMGYADLLNLLPLGPEPREYARAIKACGDTLLTLINNVLDFSKIEAGRLSFETLPYSLRETAREAAEAVRPTALAKGLALEVRIAPEVPVAQRGDATRVRQVLCNLLGNAVKFTFHGGVLLTCRPRAGRTGWLELEIADTGEGIPATLLSAIFDPYDQGRADTARRCGGTGLGLAISQRIARGMGGDLVVSSTPGEGSVFRFWLPNELRGAPGG
ncbi:MAG: sensor histidine kinase [Candidatus Krumholzibacteriia bacterium]